MATKKKHERAMTLLDELKSIFSGLPKKKSRPAKPLAATPKATRKTKKKSKTKKRSRR